MEILKSYRNLKEERARKFLHPRSDRDAKEGSVFIKVSDDKKEAVLIALNWRNGFCG
jgi:elongation factor Ts